MADTAFKLPGSSFDELSRIIAGYSNIEGDASPTDVAKVVSVDPTTVSRNNAFLTQLGLIESRPAAKKATTDLGRDLGRAIEHNVPERVQEVWRDVVSRSEFLKQLVTAVRIRRGMDPSGFISHVGYSAGLPKGATTATGARTVLSILVASGLLGSADGRIVALEPQISSSREIASTVGPDMRSLESDFAARHDLRIVTPSGVTVNIEIKIAATPDQLGGLGAQITQLLRDIETTGREEQDETPA